MENLESARKLLKVLGIICIVFGGLGVLLGGLALLGGGLLAGGMAGSATSGMDADSAATVTGLVLIASGVLLISAIFTLLLGIFSVRGANDFSKIGAAWVIAIINLGFAVLGVIASLAGGSGFSSILSGIVSLALAGAIFWAANTIKQSGASGAQMPPFQQSANMYQPNPGVSQQNPGMPKQYSGGPTGMPQQQNPGMYQPNPGIPPQNPGASQQNPAAQPQDYNSPQA